MRTRLLFTLLVCFGVATGVGCKSLDINGNDSDVSTEKDSPWWKKDDLPPVKPAAKIVAIWSNSVLNENGAPPIRGLGGRVYFYDSKHQPVRVDGKLTVFLYDDTNKTSDERQEATRKIDFTAEEVAEKYTPTEFGPSYSFWVPWDAVGGERVQLSVIPVFTSLKGEMLVGEQAKYLLPGRKPAELAKDPKKEGVVPASFVGEEAESGQKLRLTTSTIKVPPSVQRRLRTPGVAAVRSSAATKSSAQGSTTQRARMTRVSDLPRTAIGRARTSRESFGRSERRPVSFTRSDEFRSAGSNQKPDTNSATTEASKQATATQPSTGYQLDQRQVQDLQSLQQAAARDPKVLDHAKQLFSRSR